MVERTMVGRGGFISARWEGTQSPIRGSRYAFEGLLNFYKPFGFGDGILDE
jgi:hypothetical protein